MNCVCAQWSHCFIFRCRSCMTVTSHSWSVPMDLLSWVIVHELTQNWSSFGGRSQWHTCSNQTTDKHTVTLTIKSAENKMSFKVHNCERNVVNDEIYVFGLSKYVVQKPSLVFNGGSKTKLMHSSFYWLAIDSTAAGSKILLYYRNIFCFMQHGLS